MRSDELRKVNSLTVKFACAKRQMSRLMWFTAWNFRISWPGELLIAQICRLIRVARGTFIFPSRKVSFGDTLMNWSDRWRVKSKPQPLKAAQRDIDRRQNWGIAYKRHELPLRITFSDESHRHWRRIGYERESGRERSRSLWSENWRNGDQRKSKTKNCVS